MTSTTRNSTFLAQNQIRHHFSELLITIDKRKTGKNLKKLRKAMNLSAQKLADMIGLGRATSIYEWEKGITLPTTEYLYAISTVLGASMNDILVRSTDEDVLLYYFIRIQQLSSVRKIR